MHLGDSGGGRRDEERGDAGLSAFAPRWRTVAAPLRVLAVVHNVTSATRMMDVLTALDADPRVQTVLTWTRSSIFTHGVEDFLRGTGRLVLEWEDAVDAEFDLAITTSLGGDLHRIEAPLLRIPHGMGYNKFLNRKPETGNRKPVFGLSREWLFHDGRLIPSSIVLSHEEQADRLAADCPDALHAACVAGDPCYDRLLASLPHRARYRRDLGLRDGQRLVLISSTWGERSLFGRHPRLPRRLLAELPADGFRVALALHPNAWHGHGPGQVEAWIADARRSGLLVLPPNEGWRAALVASDAVIGDHGSVAYYAAAVGRPVVLDRGGAEAVAPDSAVARLLAAATAFDPRRPLTGLLADAEAEQARTTAVARERVSSHPGRSLELLRREMYRLMGAEEPDLPARVDAVAPPEPLPGPAHPALWVSATGGGQDAEGLRIHRYPAAVLDRPQVADATGFLMVRDDEPDRRLSDLADLVVCPASELPEDGEAWCGRVFAHRVGATAAAYYGDEGFVLHTRDGDRIAATVVKAPEWVEPSLPTAVLFSRLTHPGGPGAFTSGTLQIALAGPDGGHDPLVLRLDVG